MRLGLRQLIADILALTILGAAGATALVIEHDDPAVNYRAPADDPGWANVGVCDRWTGVYLGHGWVLTAAHVGPANIELEGTLYQADLKSRRRVANSDGTVADLMLFRIHPEPDLPSLTISDDPPPIGSQIVMIGSGLGRGEKTVGEGRVGYRWQPPSVKRWGTSMVYEILHDRSVGNTDSFATRFSIANTAHEAHAAHGDSGGAVFAYLDDQWRLVGIILAVDNHLGQPDRSAVYGNRTMIADLAHYRDFIERVTAEPSN